MNSSIKTNQLRYEIDKKAFLANYEVFIIKTSDKYINFDAKSLDISVLDNDIKAVKYENGQNEYLLLKKDPSNREKIKKLLPKINDEGKLSSDPVALSEINDEVIIQLLLNALRTGDHDDYKFNNLTGSFYIYHSDWIDTGWKKRKKEIKKIPCLKINVSKNMCMEIQVRTFTSELFKDSMNFDKNPFAKYPKYIIGPAQTLRRRLPEDKEIGFILKQEEGKKSKIPFIDLYNVDRFKKTKMGVLYNTIKRFNEKYEGICKLEFRTHDLVYRNDYKKSSASENLERIKDVLQAKNVNLIDKVNNEESNELLNQITSIFSDKYKFTPSICASGIDEQLNIMIIHDKDYYVKNKEELDPHRIYCDMTVQHITLESFLKSNDVDTSEEFSFDKFSFDKSSLKHAISTIVNEMIIKQDIKDGKISLYDWDLAGFDKDVTFGMKDITKYERKVNNKSKANNESNEDKSDDEVEIKEKLRFFFITIHPDGSFEFKVTEQLFDNSYFAKMQRSLITDDNDKSEDKVLVIRFDDGCINVIKDTGMFTIPEIEKIGNYLKDGDNKLRGKVRREELLASCLDIKMYEDNGLYYYFVGTIGDGMPSKIDRACIIRSVEGYDNADVQYDKILPLMNVTFVRNGQLTVYPFPFKYLKEYAKMVKDSEKGNDKA